MTLKIIHGSWYMTVIEGSEAYYPTTALAAYDIAKARGYRFACVDKDEDGRVVEIWIKR